MSCQSSSPISLLQERKKHQKHSYRGFWLPTIKTGQGYKTLVIISTHEEIFPTSCSCFGRFTQIRHGFQYHQQKITKRNRSWIRRARRASLERSRKIPLKTTFVQPLSIVLSIEISWVETWNRGENRYAQVFHLIFPMYCLFWQGYFRALGNSCCAESTASNETWFPLDQGGGDAAFWSGANDLYAFVWKVLGNRKRSMLCVSGKDHEIKLGYVQVNRCFSRHILMRAPRVNSPAHQRGWNAEIVSDLLHVRDVTGTLTGIPCHTLAGSSLFDKDLIYRGRRVQAHQARQFRAVVSLEADQRPLAWWSRYDCRTTGTIIVLWHWYHRTPLQALRLVLEVDLAPSVHQQETSPIWRLEQRTFRSWALFSHTSQRRTSAKWWTSVNTITTAVCKR